MYIVDGKAFVRPQPLFTHSTLAYLRFIKNGRLLTRAPPLVSAVPILTTRSYANAAERMGKREKREKRGSVRAQRKEA